MFNIGPMELLVLGVVGFLVLGPNRLPDLARDAARLIRSLREMADGARTQLKDELGPEFGEVDLRSLNPRVAIGRMLLPDDEPRPSGDAAAPVGAPVAVAVPIPSARDNPLTREEVAPYDVDAT